MRLGSCAQVLVLLHGGAGNSTMWFYNIKTLSKHFCVYLIDIIGEAGKSDGYRPAIASGEFEQWLAEVTTKLKLTSFHLAGASLGGIIAQRFASRYPGKVSSLLLIAPANLIELNRGFIIKAILAHLFPFHFVIKRFLKHMSNGYKTFSNKAIDTYVQVYQAYKAHPNLQDIPVITNDEILSLPENSLVLVGDDDVIYDAKKALQRFHINKSIKTQLIKGANHTLSADRPEIFNQALIKHCLG